MTTPMFSTTTDDARFYEWPLAKGNHLPSITTRIKQGVPKPILQTWAIKQAAIAAIENIEVLLPLREAQALYDAEKAAKKAAKANA